MGTDIHLYAERLEDDRLWHQIAPPTECSECHGSPQSDERPCWRCENTGQDKWPSFYDQRNYTAFSILANVRNGPNGGFAGSTRAWVPPISEPKGLPEDLGPELKQSIDPPVGLSQAVRDELPYLGDHSFSYLTLEELRAYNFSSPLVHVGWVSAKEFQEWLEQGHPTGWCGDVGGAGVEKVSPPEMLRRLTVNETPEHLYTFLTWKEKGGLLETCSSLIRLMSTLSELEPNPTKIRIVFGFDS